MTKLIIGFDSAWTKKKSGALAGVLLEPNLSVHEVGAPTIANYTEAAALIQCWQSQYNPEKTIILLDQPTIVNNPSGQRPVENIVSSPISRRYGGAQPANQGKTEMFGAAAPVWPFLSQFGGAANILTPNGANTQVYETYPVLALIALGWLLPDQRQTGRLPKYNPVNRNKFSTNDWLFLRGKLVEEFQRYGLAETAHWLNGVANLAKPKKHDQDQLDACLCLLVGLKLAHNERCLLVGEQASGYMLVPYGEELVQELKARCLETKRAPEQWIRPFYLEK